MAGFGKKRTLEIMALTKEGYTIPEIGEMLGMQGSSVRRYLRHSRTLTEVPKKEGAKILLFDIETSPMEGLFWGLFKQNIPIGAITKDWAMLSWAAKWLYDDKTICEFVSPREAFDREDGSIIPLLWELLNEADIVIAHNADKFDVRKVNARLVVNGFPPPSPYMVVDTLKHSRKNFAFSSHKLDYIAHLMNKHGKIPTDFELWKRCIGSGYDVQEQFDAMAEMVTYNKSDVIALEDVYVGMLPFMKNHPNLGLYYNSIIERCPNCACENIDWLDKFYTTTVNKFQAFRCMGCGANGRSRFSALSTEERAELVSPVAR